MAKRKAISKRLRFEVFKRDSFCCQYCGRSAPDVILHVDHINPVANDGDNDLLNLITSCRDCNLGKGAKTLNDQSTLARQKEQLKELNERRLQLEMLLQWREGLADIETQKVDAIESVFTKIFNFKLSEVGRNDARKWLKKYPLEVILDAIKTSADQYLEYDANGKPTRASMVKFYDYITRICTVTVLEKENPEIRNLLYIRGILRNRIAYCPEYYCLDILKDAIANHVPIDFLFNTAKSVSSWSEFQREIDEAISYFGSAQ